MKGLQNNRSGFTLVEVVLVLVVVAVITLLGLTFYNRMNRQTAVQPGQAQASGEVQSAPKIEQASDLNKAEAVLDQTDPESNSDTAELDGMATGF